MMKNTKLLPAVFPFILFMLISVSSMAQVIDTTVVSRKPVQIVYEEGPLIKVEKEKSITGNPSVSGKVLYKSPVPNISNTLFGNLPGLFVKQGSGEPGYDNASLSMRGRATYDNGSIIIYVDGFQTTNSYFSYLSASEIESITLLKDAVSLATFGMKGANGVLWVVTKRGVAGKPTVEVQVVNGWSKPININKPYGSYDYARLYNLAVSNDNYAISGHQFNYKPAYSDAQLAAYQYGITGPDVDWYNKVLKTNGSYTNANVFLSGGDTNTRYGLVLDYMNQGGMYNVKTDDAHSNAQIERFNIRSNLDFKFLKIFEAKVDLGGRIEDRRYPNIEGTSLWNNLARYPSNIYPVKDTTSGYWSGNTLYPNNPVASVNALGWTSTHDRTLQANFNLKENLDFITPGLYMNESVSFNTWSRVSASKTATYARFINGIQVTTDKSTDLTSNGSSPTDQYDFKQVNLTLGHKRTFGKHAFNSVVNYFASDFTTDNGTNGEGQNRGNNIFYHFENISSKINYNYNSRYILEVGLGYSGSDNFAPGNKWGFYPAIAAGWLISSEPFLKNNKTIDFLKLRVSAGQSGSDQTNQGRYLFQQYFTGNGTFYTGNSSLTGNGGIVQSYAANPDIFAEKSMKYGAGFDITAFKKLSLSFDVFQDDRSGIITQDNSLSAVYGGTLPYKNVGKVTNKGFELSLGYTGKAGPVDVSFGAMAGYSKNKIVFQSEIPPLNDFSKTTGLPIGTQMGLIADGFYDITDFDAGGVLKSGIAVPTFGAVQPGDIKYKDLDNNGIVDQADVTKIGNADYPTLNYAFNLAVSYKGFEISALLQGASGNTLNLLSVANTETVAFVNNGNAFPIANNSWAYYPSRGIDTRATATYPRLTTQANDNNYRSSTFWIKKGDFARIRNVEVGYNFSAAVLKKLHLEKLRIYVSAINPVTWSSLLRDYNIDPETNSGYPGTKSFNTGISLSF